MREFTPTEKALVLEVLQTSSCHSLKPASVKRLCDKVPDPKAVCSIKRALLRTLRDTPENCWHDDLFQTEWVLLNQAVKAYRALFDASNGFVSKLDFESRR